MTSGKEAPAAPSGRPHQNSRAGVVPAHGFTGCQRPKCGETKPLFPPAEQLRPLGEGARPGPTGHLPLGSWLSSRRLLR